jgi:hypothetical protein
VARLGYRGCDLYHREGSERWRAYRDVVSHTGAGATESRLDPPRHFERTLLASAPLGLIPPGLLD